MAKPHLDQSLWEYVASLRSPKKSSPSINEKSFETVHQRTSSRTRRDRIYQPQAPRPHDSWVREGSNQWDDEDELFTTEPASEPFGYVEEPAAEPIGTRPSSYSLCAALVFTLSRLVWRTQRHSLYHWLRVVRALPRPILGMEPHMAVAFAEEALACRTATLALRDWRRKTESRQARRSVIVFCTHYRAEVLMTRSFQALVRHWQTMFSAMETSELMWERQVASEADLILDAVLDAWRRETFSAVRLRSAEHALLEYLQTKWLRIYSRAWLMEARQSREMNMKLKQHRRITDFQHTLRFCEAWHRIAGLARLTRLRFHRKVKQCGIIAWTTWIAFVLLSRRARKMAQYRANVGKRHYLHAWSVVRVTAETSRQRVFKGVFRGWCRVCVVSHLSQRIEVRHEGRILHYCFMHWLKYAVLAKMSFRVTMRKEERCARRTFKQWYFARTAVSVAKCWLQRAVVKSWRENVAWYSWARHRLVSQEHGFLQEAFQHFVMSCRLQRRKRMQEVALIDKASISNDIRRRRCALQWWSLRARSRRLNALKMNQSEIEVEGQVRARALWSWRTWAETKIDQRDHVHRATVALRAMKNTSKWAKASEACTIWAAWAKRSAERKETRLDAILAEFSMQKGRWLKSSFMRRWRFRANDSAWQEETVLLGQDRLILSRCSSALMYWAEWSRHHRQQRTRAQQLSASWAAEGFSRGYMQHKTASQAERSRRGLEVTKQTLRHSRSVSSVQRQSVSSSNISNTSSAFASGRRPSRHRDVAMRRSQSCGALPRSGKQFLTNTSSMQTSSCELSDSLRSTASQARTIQRKLSKVLDIHTNKNIAAQSKTFLTRTSVASISHDVGRPEVQMRWLRWTIALWLGSVAALPWLQWSFSLWRGASLRAELTRLKWWSFADAATSRLAPAVSRTPPQTSITKKTKDLSTREKRRLWFNDRVSKIAWANRLQSLSVFIEWAGVARHGGRFHLPDLETVWCVFSAWMLLARRDGDARRRANRIKQHCHEGNLQLASG